VLDNASDEMQIRPLLPAGQSCATVVTSRSRLGGLDSATHIALQTLSPAEAKDLIVAVAGVTITVTDTVHTDQILASCGGVPLAIRIAGATLAAPDKQDGQWLATELSHSDHVLAALHMGDRSVAASLRSSYDILEPSAARLLRLIALSPLLHVSASMCGVLLDVDQHTAQMLLDQLVSASLVEPSVMPAQPEDGPRGHSRYRFHDLVRAVARDLAGGDAPALHSDALDRLTAHYLTMLGAAGSVIGAPGVAEASKGMGRIPAGPGPVFQDLPAVLSWFEAERPNMTALVRSCVSRGRSSHAWRVAYRLKDVFKHCSLTDDWLSTTTLALGLAVTLSDSIGEARMRESLASLYASLGRVQDAIDQYDRAMVLNQLLSDRYSVARVQFSVGAMYSLLGDIDMAEHHYLAALAEPSFRADPIGHAYVLVNLGSLHSDRREYDAALDAWHQALALCAGHPLLTCVAEHNLADVLLKLQRPTEAIPHAESEVKVARATGNPLREARGYDVLGDCLVSSDSAGARRAWMHALALYRKLNHQHYEHDVLRRLLADSGSDSMAAANGLTRSAATAAVLAHCVPQ
jgi:hypothetical protein